jgi:hypothetical protein
MSFDVHFLHGRDPSHWTFFCRQFPHARGFLPRVDTGIVEASTLEQLL